MPDHLDQLSEWLLASEWRPPPRMVPRLRQVLAERVADPDWLSSALSSPVLKDDPTIGRVDLRQRDLHEADLYYVDPGVAQMAATLAHAQRHLPGAELEEHVRTLRPDGPPSRYGFMVFGLPVASDELFETVAVSWRPADGKAPSSGGVDIIAWGALATGAAAAALSHAGLPDTPRGRQQLRIRSRTTAAHSVAVVAVRPDHDTSADEWVGAAQATWAAMRTNDIQVKPWRPSWLERRRAKVTSSPVSPVQCVRWRRGAPRPGATRTTAHTDAGTPAGGHRPAQGSPATVSIRGLDPALVLIALYNNARIQGLGALHSRGSSPLTIKEAKEVLARPERVDYLHGRVLKVDLRHDDVEVWRYDQANGDGKARRVVDNLRTTGSVAEII